MGMHFSERCEYLCDMYSERSERAQNVQNLERDNADQLEQACEVLYISGPKTSIIEGFVCRAIVRQLPVFKDELLTRDAQTILSTIPEASKI
jgi:hypothetical protein